MRYVGRGFIKGIPARNLTEEEVKKFGKKRLLNSGLYKEIRQHKKKQTLLKEGGNEWQME